jgi:hypothetical protein
MESTTIVEQQDLHHRPRSGVLGDAVSTDLT